MTNFGKPIQDQTEEELLNSINLFSMEGAQVAMGELTRRRLDALQKSLNNLKISIEKFDENTIKYSKLLAVLTFVLLAVSIMQMIISISLVKPGWDGFAEAAIFSIMIIYFSYKILGYFFPKKSKKKS